MPPVVAIGVGVAAVAGQTAANIVGGNAKSDAAAQGMQNAQAMAQRLEQASLPSPQEIKILEDTIRNTEMTLSRERKLIEAVDPAIIEAGKQAHDMLRGKESELLDPVRRNRARQRASLTETLRRQMGPGFETSSAGIEAMGKFDTETSDLMAQVQSKAVNDLLGFTQNAAGMARSSEANAINQGLGVAQVFGQQRSARVSAMAAGAGLINNAQAGVTATAGGTADAIGKGLGGLSTLAGFAMGPNPFAGAKVAADGAGFFGNFFGAAKPAMESVKLANDTVSFSTLGGSKSSLSPVEDRLANYGGRK